MVRLRVRPLLTALLAASFAAAALGASAHARGVPPIEPAAILVIVHEDVPARAISREQLRRIFLARDRFWSDGRRIAPVNLPAGSALRETFSRRVLGRTSRELAAYWNDLYFHGTLPPQTVASEQAVLRFVANTAGAIGYVTADAAAVLPAGVRMVLSLEGGSETR